jgi:hypothetical protein
MRNNLVIQTQIYRLPKIIWGLNLALIAFLSVSVLATTAKADNCTNGGSGSVYTCSGQITTTQGGWPTGADLTVTLLGNISTSTSLFNGSPIFSFNPNGHDVTYSGGTPQGLFSSTGANMIMMLSGVGNGNFNITNNIQLNGASSDITSSNATALSLSQGMGFFSTSTNAGAAISVTNALNANINLTSGNVITTGTNGALDFTNPSITQAAGIQAGSMAGSSATFNGQIRNDGNITVQSGNLSSNTYGNMVLGGSTAVGATGIAFSGSVNVRNTGTISATSANAKEALI